MIQLQGDWGFDTFWYQLLFMFFVSFLAVRKVYDHVPQIKEKRKTFNSILIGDTRVETMAENFPV